MLTNYARTLRQFNRNVRLYLLATGLLGFAFDGGVYTVLFNLYLLRLGFGPEYIGQVNSAGLLGFALASLPAGALGSRFGNRRMMVLGLLLIMTGGLGLPLAEQLPRAWLGAGLLIAYVTSFVGLALYFVNSVPFAMDITTPEERNHAFSMQTALLALAAFSGALVGGLLPRLVATVMGIDQQQPAPYRLPLVFAATLMALALWAILRTRVQVQEATPEEVAPSENAREAAPVRRWGWESAVVMTLLLLSTVRFFQVAGVGVVVTFFNVYLDTALRAPTAQIGALTALARLMAVPAALITPVLAARWGAPRTVVWASAATTLSLLPLALAPYWVAAGLGLMGVTAFSSMRYPAYLVYSM
ncbi:MAG TPA: MFS transporter, partial [Caldilineaceae bacterium]|nr:MFS transporter [Caldilineaceae bacterium]